VSDRGPLVVDDTLAIPRGELTVRATRAGGPGGQHVNTSSTRVELLWNPATSQVLDDGRRQRLLERLAARLDGEGNVRVVASEFRSQAQNRVRAEERLAELVRRALVVPKKRKKTRPSRGAIERRLEEKRRQSLRKRDRRGGDD
jgi:ribosome-associated protein